MKRYYLFLVLLAALKVYAQHEIETSPDQYETPGTVPAHRFQMENRFMHQKENREARTYTIPSANWKYGLNDHIEINMTTNFINFKMHDSTATGLEPVLAGLKVRLWYQNGWIPHASVTTQIQLPRIASKDLKATYAAPRIVMHFKNAIAKNVNLGYNAGAEWDGESPEPVFTYTVSPKLQLSDKLECFIESYGYLPQQHKAEHWTDAGFMYLITKDIQLEVSGSYELTSQNSFHRYYQLLGFAFRI